VAAAAGFGSRFAMLQDNSVPCVLCGRPDVTKEHVFPQWLLDVIPRKGAIPGGKIIHRWDAPPGSESEDREWEAHQLTFQAKVVCQNECNGGWMSKLENGARPFLEPMIQGRGRTLYDTGREQVAFWALKTAMMIDFAQEPEHRSVRPDEYPALYKAQTVLPDTFAWLGACEFGPGATAHHRTLQLNVDGRRLHGWGCTVNVGHMVIEVIRFVRFPQGKTLEIGGPLAPALRRIWPQDQPVFWPPNARLTRQQTVWLGQMLESVPISLVPL